MPLRNGFEECARGRIGAFEIVDPTAREKLILRTPDAACRAIVQKQIAADHALLRNARLFGKLFGKRALCGFVAVDRQKINLRIVFVAVVDLAVEVNGHIGNQYRIAIEIDQPRFNAALRAHEQPSGDSERAIEPARHQHSAVFFGIQADVMTGGFVLARGLQLKRRRITVTCDDLKRRKARFRHAERDQRRAIAGHIIFSAGHDGPAFAFVQRAIAVRLERMPKRVDRMKRGRRLFHKINKISGRIHLRFLPCGICIYYTHLSVRAQGLFAPRIFFYAY